MQRVKERVAEVYYCYGLVCASHPYAFIFMVISISCCICYPLLSIPLPGNAPLEHSVPAPGYRSPPDYINLTTLTTETVKGPSWYHGPPVAYIQQIIIRSTVSPWEQSKMIRNDAFRLPLAKVFELLDHLNNFQYKHNGKVYSLSDFCLHVSESLPERKLKFVLPQYSCLVLSPANLWNRDLARFQSDGEIINTIYKNYGASNMEMVPPLRELLFGMAWIETGISRYFLRNRQRVISYAVTIMLQSYNESFFSALKEKLHQLYPHSATSFNSTAADTVENIYFKDVHNFLMEYIPLVVAYVVLFLYLYFSVCKIQMVKSKWGLAFSAVAMVLASLLMSLSICTFFGLHPSINRGEIFPYLVVVIGLENVLVLTKSVVSTPIDLDVKIRVAQGLSKESWSITKNFCLELLIVVGGFFTFIPAIQEFCLFAVVGLFTDFFLQMGFFVTVLSIDIRRMELNDLHKQHLQMSPKERTTPSVTPSATPSPAPGMLLHCPVMDCFKGPQLMQQPTRSHSSLPKSTSAPAFHTPQRSIGRPPTPPPSPYGQDEFIYMYTDPDSDLPRRIRLIYFWARTRVVQRVIMVSTVIWIALIVYKSGLVEHLVKHNASTFPGQGHSQGQSYSLPQNVEKFIGREVDYHAYTDDPGDYSTRGMKESSFEVGGSQVASQLVHSDGQMWRKLSYQHWPSLLEMYNISTSGSYVSILPSVHLSIVADPEAAIRMRHPKEQEEMEERLIKAKTYFNGENLVPQSHVQGPLPLYAHSTRELVITVILGVMSVFLGIYFMMILYRCVCSRNYAKWRSSWSKSKKRTKASPYFKMIKEALPLRLIGHNQEIECMVTDGPLLISCCLGGQLRVWDTTSGECLTVIHRKWITPPDDRTPIPGRNINDSDMDLYAEYHEAPLLKPEPSDIVKRRDGHKPVAQDPVSTQFVIHRRQDRFTSIPDLTGTIDTNFSSLLNRRSKQDSPNPQSPGSIASIAPGYDFASKFSPYYREHQQLQVESRRYEQMKEQHRRSLGDMEATTQRPGDQGRYRSRSLGTNDGPVEAVTPDCLAVRGSAPAIWCLESQDNLIVAGCGNGKIEFWDALSGSLKCLYEGSRSGVTGICFQGKKVIAARLDGTLDFLELETYTHSPVVPSSTTPPSVLHNRGLSHRAASRQLGSTMANTEMKPWDDIIHCSHIVTVTAHQQPINILEMAGGRVVTASQDQTLKVYRIEDSLCLYTLHGHTASVTALFLDKGAPLAAASGSEDCSVRLWDLLTGACVHKLLFHQATVTSLVCTPVYVVSTGMDDILCIWERCGGHLLHYVQMESACCNALSMLTSNLLVSGGQGCIVLWDLSKGQHLRTVRLGNWDNSVFVRNLVTVGNSVIISDYGNELRIVHFPSVLEKVD